MMAALSLGVFVLGFTLGAVFAVMQRKPAPPHGTLPLVWVEPDGIGELQVRICAAYSRLGTQYKGIVATVPCGPESVATATRDVMQRCISELQA